MIKYKVANINLQEKIMDFIKNFTKAIESLADFQPHMFNGATEKSYSH